MEVMKPPSPREGILLMVAVVLWGGDHILFALVFLTCEIGDPQRLLLCCFFWALELHCAFPLDSRLDLP